MSNELARHEPNSLAQALTFSQEQRVSIKSMIGGAIKTDVQFSLFLATAESLGLNPLAREIYGWTDYRDPNKLVTAVGIDGFRKKGAERCPYDAIEHAFCGEDGVWKDVWVSQQPPLACRCRIYVKGSPRAIEQTIYYSEFFVEKNPNWKQRPKHMMMVRSEAHAWRKVPGAGLANIELLEDGAAPQPVLTETFPDALPAGATAAAETVYDTPHQPEPEPAQPIDPRKAATDRWQHLTGTQGTVAEILASLALALGIDAPAKSADVTADQWRAFLAYLTERGLPPTPATKAEPAVDWKARACELYQSLGGSLPGIVLDLAEALDIEVPQRTAAVTPGEWERFTAHLEQHGLGAPAPTGSEQLELE